MVLVEKEYGFVLGGLIIQDKVYFFVIYEVKCFDLLVIIVLDGVVIGVVGLLLFDGVVGFGLVSQLFQQDLIFVKIDFELIDNDCIELIFQDCDEIQLQFSGQILLEVGCEVVNIDCCYVLCWNYSGECYYNEMMVIYEDLFNNLILLILVNGIIYIVLDGIEDCIVVKIGGVLVLDFQVKGQKGWLIEDNLILDGIQWMGDYIIKMGVKYKQIDLYVFDVVQINLIFIYSLGDLDFLFFILYKVQFVKLVIGVLGVFGEVCLKFKQIGLFIQDDWQVNDYLQFNFGLCWDYEKILFYLDFVILQQVVDVIYLQDLCVFVGQIYVDLLVLGGLDISDYISIGKNCKVFKDVWQLCLGFLYDINVDEQYVIYGGVGCLYDCDLFDNLQLEIIKLVLLQLIIYFCNLVIGICINGQVVCYDWNLVLFNGIGNLQNFVGVISNVGLEVDLLNNNLKVLYLDQFSLGMSNQIGEWLIDVMIVCMLSYDGFVFILGNCYLIGQFFDDLCLCGGFDLGLSQVWSCNVLGFGSLIIGQQGIKICVIQVLLLVQKLFIKESGWGILVVYIWIIVCYNCDINEKYVFDCGLISEYLIICLNGVLCYCLVVIGLYVGFWGIIFGGKIILVILIVVNDWYLVLQVSGYNLLMLQVVVFNVNGKFLLGGKIFGYCLVDLQVMKMFKMVGDIELYVCLDIINVFNFDNFFIYNYVKINGKLEVSYNEIGEIIGMLCQVKVEVGFCF